jgi:hypothetical protein
MAENVLPPNATNPSVVLAEGNLVAAGNTLANLNGNHSRGMGPKQAEVKKIDAKLDIE